MAEHTEWTFAAEVAKWMSLHLQGRRNLPFVDAKVETKTAGSLKRRDLTLYDRDGNKALTGEIRFPDAVDGQTPYNATIVTDARRKARAAKSPFFFTWNVNRLVLWKTDEAHEVRPPYDVVRIRRGADLAYPSVERIIREEFIPKFLEEYAAIFRGDEATGVLPLDRRFIGRLESALDNLANSVFTEAFFYYQKNQAFKKALDKWMKDQEWLLADDEQLTRDNLDRATRLACYITANKLVFYQGLRRNRKFRLEKLTIPKQITSAERLRDHFNGLFEQAKIVTRDYQTIFDGGFIDRVPFIADLAVDRWRAFVSLLDEFDFRQFGQDVIGHIFEDLLSPEERHRWGQHYTQPVVVDVINAFCIRNPKAVVLDPSSGSGTFLVRAYARKRHLARGALQHADLLAQLYACEISQYASHLTSLNLATRDLIDGENFPRVARADFFDTQIERIFCSVPDTSKDVGTEATKDIHLTHVDAVIGNPPYLEQTKIPKCSKQQYMDLVKDEWPGLKLSGRSDLHIYFWPHACKLLSEGGYFGFVTSSSWLDTEYGFHLQRWILQHFQLVAVLESTCEPWFTGARVTTCVTILRRCSDPVQRFKNLVHFVQLRKPLKEILANDGTEAGRQEASEKLRGLIESTKQDNRTADYRILVVPQQKLWDDGCKLGRLAAEEENGEETNGSVFHENPADYHTLDEYVGGKWGVYLRAPDFYFQLMEKYGGSFVPLIEIADVKYGFKSGCDDFFAPFDITDEALTETDLTEFRHRYHCPRKDVTSGKIRIVRADGSEHPVESEYLLPEIHSLRTIDSVLITRDLLKRKILLVNKSLDSLKGKYVQNYIRYGQRETFGGEVTVAKRESCASRPRWYDVTNYPTGTIVFPIIVQYRHIISWNPDKLPVNHALMVIESKSPKHNKALAAVLNSTLVAFIKPYFSRKLGNEANTKLDIYAANILPVPNLAEMSDKTIEALAAAFDALGDRPVTKLVEQRLLDMRNVSDLKEQDAEPREWPLELQQPDRQALDKAVLKAIGVPAGELESVQNHLYQEVTRYWNSARLVELQAKENRKRSKKGRTANSREVAQEIFEGLEPAQVRRFPNDFLSTDEPLETVELPEGKAKLYDINDLYDANSLAVGKTKLTFRHRAQVELAKLFCDMHRAGFVKLPTTELVCKTMKHDWESYSTQMQIIFQSLATERTDDEDRQEAIIAELNRLLTVPVS